MDTIKRTDFGAVYLLDLPVVPFSNLSDENLCDAMDAGVNAKDAPIIIPFHQGIVKDGGLGYLKELVATLRDTHPHTNVYSVDYAGCGAAVAGKAFLLVASKDPYDLPEPIALPVNKVFPSFHRHQTRAVSTQSVYRYGGLAGGLQLSSMHPLMETAMWANTPLVEVVSGNDVTIRNMTDYEVSTVLGLTELPDKRAAAYLRVPTQVIQHFSKCL